MTSLPERLGSFLVGDRIGAGGMSEVFLGEHWHTGDRVALKVTEFSRAAERRRRAFSAEVATMARLYHPGIVRVHDWGTIGDGRATWYAMDYSPRGVVSGARNWEELHAILSQTLRALAHAHAHDVVHRDLKGENILVFGSDENPKYRLADFGIAHLRIPNADTRIYGGVSGTPYYMPPEQLHGRWREYGPWTDLYALGCLAYELAADRPPFAGSSPLEVAMQHIRASRPRLAPHFEVPAGFEAWVLRLMERDWRQRPASAVAVLEELDALGAPVKVVDDSAIVPTAYENALTQELDPSAGDFGFTRTELMETLVALDVDWQEERSRDSGPTQVTNVALPPADWRLTGSSTRSFRDAGLQLFELRQTAFVGHEPVRDTIWGAVTDTLKDREVHVVVVDGESARELALLVDWARARTRETTGLLSFHVEFSDTESAAESFLRSLATFLNAHSLAEHRLVEHLGQFLPSIFAADETIVEELTDLLATDRDVPLFAERIMPVVQRVIRQTASNTPLIITATGVHDVWPWMLAEVLLTLDDLPIVMLLANSPEAGEPCLEETAVRQHERTAEGELSRLTRAEAEQLLDSYLMLEPELRTEMVEHAIEDTEFAVELTRFAILYDALEPTPAGFAVIEGAGTQPRNFEELVSMRLAILASKRPAAARIARAFAAWGTHADYQTWDRITAAVAPSRAADDTDALLRHRFVEDTGEGYRMPSDRVRLQLRRQLSTEIVEALVEIPGHRLEDELRRARILSESGSPSRAARLLFERLSAAPALLGGDPRQLTKRIDELQAALPPDDPARARAYVIRCRTKGSNPGEWSVDELERWLNDPAIQHDEMAQRHLRYFHGLALYFNRRYDEGSAVLEELVEASEAAGDCRTAGLAWSGLGWCRMIHDQVEPAIDAIETAIQQLSTRRDRPEGSAAVLESKMLARCHTFLAALAEKQGDSASYERHFDTALELLEDTAREQYPRFFLERATGRLLAGKIEEATADAMEAWRLGIWSRRYMLGPIGTTLAICLALGGDSSGAQRIIRQGSALLHDNELRMMQLRCGAAVVAAIEGDRDAWDEQTMGLDGYFVPRVMELAAEKWAEHGDEERAAHAARLAKKLS